MRKRYRNIIIIVLGFFAFSALAYVKIGPERLMLWYYKYYTRNTLILAIPFIAAFVVLCIIALFAIWRFRKLQAKRAKEEAGIDLRDLFSNNGPL